MCAVPEQDVSRKAVFDNPRVYAIGMKNKDLNFHVIAGSIIQAIVEATLIYYLCKLCYGIADGGVGIWQGGNGDTADIYIFGTTVFSVMVTSMLVKVGVLHYTWNWYSVAGMVFSVALYVGFLFAYASTPAIFAYVPSR